MANQLTRVRSNAGVIPHSVDSEKWRVVNYYMEALEFSYRRYKPTIDRLQSLTNAYENVLNAALFPTISKMAVPDHFAMVQESLPIALDYVWPDSQRTYTLNPLDMDVDMERLDRAEYALNYIVRQRMRAKWTTLPSIINALKTGIGYSAIVPMVKTPPATINMLWTKGGQVQGSQQSVGIGRPVKTLAIKNVGVGQIIPSDDGSDFNGDDRVSHVWWVDLYHEGEFRRMFKKLKSDVEDADVSGDVEFLIKQANDFGFTTKIPLASIIAELGGIEIDRKTANPFDGEYVQVPVIKCYGDQEIVWIANGTTVIYHEKDPIQVLHRPLVKWSVTVDNSKWHPMNPAEAGATIANGKNLYYNLMMDLAIRATRPYMVYDKSRTTGGKPPIVGVDGMIGVDGSAGGEVINFPAQPQINQGHAMVSNMLDGLYARAVGQSDALQNPTPGMVRGGLHALESIIASTQGRQKVGAMIMEMGAVEPIGQLTMIYMQKIIENGGMAISEREFDNDTGEGRVKRTNVTPDDIRVAYEVSLDTRGKVRTTTDFNERAAVFNLIKDDPYFDPYTTREFLVGSYPNLRNGQYSRKKSREIQERLAQQQAQEAQAAQAGSIQNAPGGTPQAIEAGAALGGAQ